MFDFPLGIDTKLNIVAICSSDNANTLDLFDGELLYSLVSVSNQFETAYPTTISEGDMTTIIVKLPARGLVLHTSVIPLEFGVSLLSWFLLLAIVIEAGDGKPRTISRCLTSLGIESRGKRALLGKHSTIGLQVVFGGATLVHPQAQRLIADELNKTDGFINSRVLLLGTTQLVLVDQHVRLLAFLLFLDMLFYCCQDLSIQGSIVLLGYLSYLFQQMRREPDGERFYIVFHVASMTLNQLYVNRHSTPVPKPPRKERPFIPRLKDGGFLGR